MMCARLMLLPAYDGCSRRLDANQSWNRKPDTSDARIVHIRGTYCEIGKICKRKFPIGSHEIGTRAGRSIECDWRARKASGDRNYTTKKKKARVRSVFYFICHFESFRDEEIKIKINVFDWVGHERVPERGIRHERADR